MGAKLRSVLNQKNSWKSLLEFLTEVGGVGGNDPASRPEEVRLKGFKTDTRWQLNGQKWGS